MRKDLSTEVKSKVTSEICSCEVPITHPNTGIIKCYRCGGLNIKGVLNMD